MERIEKHLKRIADAMDRAYPKSPLTKLKNKITEITEPKSEE